MSKEIKSICSVTDFQQTEWWWRCWQTSTKRWSRRIRTELNLLVHTHVECSLVSKKDPQYCLVAFRISLKKLMFFKIYCNDEWRDVTLHCDGDQGNWHRHSSGELLVSLVCYCVGQVWQGGKHRVRGNVTADGKRQASPAIIPRRWQRRAASVSASTIQPQRYLQSQRSHQEHHLVSVRPLGSPLQYPLRLFTLKTFRLTK